jgi:competence protein ComEC
VLIRSLIGILFVLALSLVYQRYFNTFLKITFFDIGQGDAILIEFPQGKRMLIDAGGGMGDFSYGKRDLYFELASKGILALDAVVLTHPDRDHGYGFLGLSEHVKFQELWLNSLFLKEPRTLTSSLLGIAEISKTKVHSFSHPEEISWQEVKIKAIPLSTKEGGDNNRCLVLFLDYGPCRFLFTGDIEFPGESDLLNDEKGRINVLKVAHHGSRGSTSDGWLQSFQPQLAILSVGAKNSYGHPHYELLTRLKKRKIPLLRTDFHGFVEISASKEGVIHCNNALGSCGTLSCR